MKASTIASLSAHVLVASLAPWLTYLGGQGAITGRMLACTAIGSAITGATALLAFINTANADDKSSEDKVLNPSKL